jgi:hypothetical protein
VHVGPMRRGACGLVNGLVQDAGAGWARCWVSKTGIARTSSSLSTYPFGHSFVPFRSTNAAWCMLGHMLGLGDRHCENIMVDTSSGDTVHVDFGCLFDRGLILEVTIAAFLQ